LRHHKKRVKVKKPQKYKEGEEIEFSSGDFRMGFFLLKY